MTSVFVDVNYMLTTEGIKPIKIYKEHNEKANNKNGSKEQIC